MVCVCVCALVCVYTTLHTLNAGSCRVALQAALHIQMELSLWAAFSECFNDIIQVVIKIPKGSVLSEEFAVSL